MKRLISILRSRKYGSANSEMKGLKSVKNDLICDKEIADKFDQLCGFTGSSETALSPFYLAQLAYPAVSDLIYNEDLRINLLKLVHSAQSIKIFHPILHGDNLSLEAEISEIDRSAIGDVILLSATFTRDDTVVARTNSEFITKLRRRTGEKPQYTNTRPSSEKPETFTIQTVKKSTKQYALLSEDRNPIHTSAIIARMAGFPGAIMHGMHTMGITTATLVKRYAGNSWKNLDYVSMRFSRFIIPGEELSVSLYDADSATLHFTVKKSDGKDALNEGTLHLREN
ncbi:MAG: MaoC/PaaZ C-terminal domain-containing protein [Spirochaetes bacterium]|jgi:acyl dehydratase|nr:MaoC/PaaZ C-terminal domain-containing protein [Spirochaetota bacterium]